MQKLANSLFIEAFMYPWEDAEKVCEALGFVLGTSAGFSKTPGKNAVVLKKQPIESYHGSVIERVFFQTQKQGEINCFLKRLSLIPLADKREIAKTLADRLDNEGNLFVRFGKQEAAKSILALKYSGDVVKARLKIAAFPFSLAKARENAAKILE